MIPSTTIIKLIESALDAEGFDRYTFERDYKPAINYAQDFVVGAFSSVLGDKKFPEENLSDLIFNRVFKSNVFSRIVLDGDGIGDVWSILRVSVNPEITPNTDILQPDTTKSVYSDKHSFVKAYKDAGRVNAEEANMSRLNPFAKGNEVAVCDELKEYAFKLYTNYKGGYDPTQTIGGIASVSEIEIFPEYKNKVCAIEYIKYPRHIESESDSVEFPPVLTDVLVQKALSFIAYKRDEVPLAAATKDEINNLVNLMI